jgi:hypothetical protein
VIDSASGTPIPYATVAIQGRGVITDREGRFELHNATAAPTDSVTISHVGFDTETRTVGDLATNPDIPLQQGVYNIEPITVTNRRSRLTKLGHSSSGIGEGGWFNEEATKAGNIREAGVPIKIRRDSDILSFRMLIRRNGYERVLMRLSFYSLDGNTPGEHLVQQDIRFELTDHFTGWYELDLTPYAIRLAGDREVLVAMTLLEEEMGTDTAEPFMLGASLLGRFFHRNVGSDAWEKFSGVTLTMYLNAREYR